MLLGLELGLLRIVEPVLGAVLAGVVLVVTLEESQMGCTGGCLVLNERESSLLLMLQRGHLSGDLRGEHLGGRLANDATAGASSRRRWSRRTELAASRTRAAARQQLSANQLVVGVQRFARRGRPEPIVVVFAIVPIIVSPGSSFVAANLNIVVLVISGVVVIVGAVRGSLALRFRLSHLHAKDGTRRQVGIVEWPTCDDHLQTHGPSVFVSLLALQGHLLGHNSLPLSNQVALGTETIPKLAVALVAFEPADDSVIPAASAFGSSRGRRRALLLLVVLLLLLVLLSVGEVVARLPIDWRRPGRSLMIERRGCGSATLCGHVANCCKVD